MASGKRSGLLKYNFQLGEVVLCFEPDPTKARVLYDAKILETSQLKAKSGQEIPAYRIHFQGWNNSWDRTVAENLILKSSEENRRLMKKLAETAKCYRNNRLRKIKINDILEKAFKHKPLVFHFDADLEDDSDSSDQNSNENFVQNGNGNKNETSDDSDDDYVDVELTIPKVLREKLEEDFLMINKRKKLLRLPAEPNIISVLEGYVKNFSINVFYGLSDRWKFVGEKNFSASMKSIPMCREVVDGIRICFDFTLRTVLLYSFEKEQFSNFMNQHCSNGQQNVSSFCQTVNTNCDSSCDTKPTSRRKTIKHQRTEIVKLSKNVPEKSHLDNQTCIESNSRNTNEMKTALATTPTLTISPSGKPFYRRVTRQYLAETSKAVCSLWHQPRSRGRGRRKLKESEIKRHNGQQKTARRGGCRGRRGRKPLSHLSRQDLKESFVPEEKKMDHCTTAPSAPENRESEIDNFKKSECGLGSTAKCPAKSFGDTFTSSMVLQSSSNAVTSTVTTTTSTVHAVTTSSGTPSQGCILSAAPVQLKTEEGVQSTSSSSGPHPHHLTSLKADSSLSSLPQNIDLDQNWPYHNLVKEVFYSPAGQIRISDILTWKLLSPAVYSECPPQPSLVCGPHQLLRLFVKLPELLCKMDLPDMKLNLLVYYLENFLEYLASRHEDLFPGTAYIDAV